MKNLKLTLMLFLSMVYITNAQILKDIDQVGTLNEGLVAVKKGDTWGFMDEKGAMVIDFRTDLVTSEEGPKFSDGFCLVQEIKDGITYYGFINTKGDKVIPTEYLAATPFHNGLARVIKHYKTDIGATNALGKNIVKYTYNELIINSKNESVQHLRGPNHLLFDQLELKKNAPTIESTFINDHLIAVKENDNSYSVYNLNEQ